MIPKFVSTTCVVNVLMGVVGGGGGGQTDEEQRSKDTDLDGVNLEWTLWVGGIEPDLLLLHT